MRESFQLSSVYFSVGVGKVSRCQMTSSRTRTGVVHVTLCETGPRQHRFLGSNNQNLIRPLESCLPLACDKVQECGETEYWSIKTWPIPLQTEPQIFLVGGPNVGHSIYKRLARCSKPSPPRGM